MVVFVVINTSLGAGIIEGVFSSNVKAAEYMTQNPYSSFILSEHTVDKHCVVKKYAKA